MHGQQILGSGIILGAILVLSLVAAGVVRHRASSQGIGSGYGLGDEIVGDVTALADLAAYGVAFISLRDNPDSSTPSARLMFHVVAVMAVAAGKLLTQFGAMSPHRETSGRYASGCSGRHKLRCDPAELNVLR